MREKEFIDEIVTELYKRLEENHALSKKAFVVGPMDQNLLKTLSMEYDVITKEEKVKDYDLVLITELSVELLAHLALGCPMEEREQIILRALLMGKNVYLLQQGIELNQYRDTAYKNLFVQYQEYLDQIKLFGIQIIADASSLMWEETIGEKKTMGEMKSIGQKNEIPSYEKTRRVKETAGAFHHATIDYLNKKVLLEKDLLDDHVQRNTVIRLSQKCIITPLAEDYIRMHMISVQRE